MARYRIDPDRSRVTIDASSSVHPIHARVTGLTGWVEVTDDGLRGHVELPVDRLRSGNPLEDRELRRRIDAKRHPVITGDVTTARDAGGGRWSVSGAVTFRGVTRPHDGDLVVDAADDDGAGGVRVRGESTFDVRDFGMEPPRILVLRVHPDVRVAIDVVAVPDA